MQIENRQAELDQFCAQHCPPQKLGAFAPTENPTKLTPWENKLLLALKKDPKFERLFDGMVDDYPSGSEADAALCIKLAYWFDRNPEAMEWAAYQSELKRPKWDRRDGEYGTYLKRTIFKALSLPDKSDKSDKSDNDDTTRQNPTKPDKTRQIRQGESQRYDGNLAGDVEEWVNNSKGYFHIRDIYTDLGVTHRLDKQNVSGALRNLIIKGIVHRDRQKNGVYHKLETELAFVDLTAPCEPNFQVTLPLDLSSLVNIPKKRPIVVAGTTNAGKTTFALNTCRLNFNQDYPLLYLMSEMGEQEFRERVENFREPLETWNKRLRAAHHSCGFNGPITHHNPDGLTIVDFLEEVDGEYFKISSNIRAIYDALGDGVAVICLQKKTDNPFGRGGEATAEKAGLYLAMDNLLEVDGGVISALKIIKAKSYKDKNPNGKERHIRIPRGGAEMIPLSGWMYCNQSQRGQLVEQYRKQFNCE